MDELNIFPSDLARKLRDEGVHTLLEIPALLQEVEETGTSGGFAISKSDIDRIRVILRKVPNRENHQENSKPPLIPLLRITHCPHCGKQLWKKRGVSYWEHISSGCKTNTGVRYLSYLPLDQIVLFCKTLNIPLNDEEVILAIERNISDRPNSIPSIHAILGYPNLRWNFRKSIIESLQLAPRMIKQRPVKERQEIAMLFFECVIFLNRPKELARVWNLILTIPHLNGGMTTEKLSMWRERLEGIEEKHEETERISSQTEIFSFPKFKLKIGDRLEKSLAAATNLFLSRCRTRSIYATVGSFNLNIPNKLIFPLGLSSLKININVDSKGMEIHAYLLDTDFEFQWTPNENWAFGKGVIGIFFHAILSAIWHDLRVSGIDLMENWNMENRSMAHPFQDQLPNIFLISTTTNRLPSRKHPSYIYLPRSSFHTLSKDREKASYRLARNTTTWVAGHLMLLPIGKKASYEALRRAEYDGVLVPSGMTYVRPHLRGSGEASNVSRKVVATGLNTLCAVVIAASRHNS